MGKIPSFPFYPQDWRSDTKLQSCDLAARGLLIEIMCIMHQSEKYGYLLINGGKPDVRQMCKVLNTHHNTLIKHLNTLLVNGVLKRDDNEVLYCCRMVKDEQLRQQWRKRKRRERKRDVTPDVPPDVTEKSHPISSSISSSNNKPITTLPKTDPAQPKKTSKKKKLKNPPSEHKKIIDLYFDLKNKQDGVKPKFDGGDGALIKKLLTSVGDEMFICDCLTWWFSDDCRGWCERKGNEYKMFIWEITHDVKKFYNHFETIKGEFLKYNRRASVQKTIKETADNMGMER